MTREDINDIINAICPNDEDYEKPCISPKYLRQELEQLALDQRQWNEDSTTKNDLKVYSKLMVELDNLSSVIPIRPRGHWIKAELPTRDAHECSECSGLALVDEDGNEQLTDFCPYCGANMKEVEE